MHRFILYRFFLLLLIKKFNIISKIILLIQKRFLHFEKSHLKTYYQKKKFVFLSLYYNDVSLFFFDLL